MTERHAEHFNVDIGGPFQAILPALSFEGATRRNKPDLHRGDAVYAKVSDLPHSNEPQLTCIPSSSASGEMLGPLKGGYIFGCSSGLARYDLCF